ncbi:MAG TPA: hypothetical protein VJP80_07190 [Candidatus Saccharimonadales bacterium]|nr:hypothetical protein [Candidatus Saccharimonadales bacterium]
MVTETNPGAFDPYGGLGEDGFYAQLDHLVDTGAAGCYAMAREMILGVRVEPPEVLLAKATVRAALQRATALAA